MTTEIVLEAPKATAQAIAVVTPRIKSILLLLVLKPGKPRAMLGALYDDHRTNKL